MGKKYLKSLVSSVLFLSMNLTQTTAFAAEVKTYQLGAGNVTIENNVGIADTINVSGVTEGSIIKIYKDATRKSAIATTKVAVGKTEANLRIPQLGIGAGKVFVTLTNPKCSESDRTECSYDAEVKTYQLGAGNVIIENNVGIADTINVSGVTEGSIIKIYKDATRKSAIATTKVAVGKTEANLRIPQLGIGAGKVFVTLTNPKCSESDRTECSYDAEVKTYQLGAGNVTIENNVGIADTINVSGVTEGSIIKIYKDATRKSAIATTKVAVGKTEANLRIPQLGIGAGKVFVTLTNPKCSESDRTECSYDAEAKTFQLGAGNVTIENNVGMADTIYISGDIIEGTIIKVYTDATGGSTIATTTVAAGKAEATLSIPQLGTEAGRVFITLTKINPKCLESDRTECYYSAEEVTN